MNLEKFRPRRCLVVGATGGLGREFTRQLVDQRSVETIYCWSRTGTVPFHHTKLISDTVDFAHPDTIELAEENLPPHPLDFVIVATGLLHSGTEMVPEKSLERLDSALLQKSFQVNTIGPALVMKALLPRMNKMTKSVFAALSARVGSISDNRLGGWYSYRAAKAALNQIIKSGSIEQQRRNSKGIVIGLHPGTVDTALSQPFQRGVPVNQLFTPEFSVKNLLSVVDKLEPDDTGQIFAWDGSSVPS